MFVSSTSMSKPFGARVIGSWLKRNVFTPATLTRPWELTNVATDALTREGIRNEMGANVMHGILFHMAVVAGAAMCDELTTKRWFGLERLITPSGNGAEKLAGVPASLPIVNRYMVTYLPCKHT
jgi:hypothetical protein